MTPSVSLVVARLVQTQPTPQACKHHQTGKGPSQASRKVWPSEQTNEENGIVTKKKHILSQGDDGICVLIFVGICQRHVLRSAARLAVGGIEGSVSES